MRARLKKLQWSDVFRYLAAMKQLQKTYLFSNGVNNLYKSSVTLLTSFRKNVQLSCIILNEKMHWNKTTSLCSPDTQNRKERAQNVFRHFHTTQHRLTVFSSHRTLQVCFVVERCLMPFVPQQYYIECKTSYQHIDF